ncbi:type II toxin-antitoxin system RelE/ParE family toxin [Paraburkholderia strydomiana]|uniref:type II toxin-antitoxin system RelE/ParE family toxin n=1 Tax=Paraburkholderia strydomiana TaxID=1245417 RepID=UPI002855D48E|nr:type II toxin-antitoxin system RelE/ParE family toxin [Paraburkholderia strydomiana]MDR7006055.1 hypothetical protein [Paraburkholderia strydomiana]
MFEQLDERGDGVLAAVKQGDLDKCFAFLQKAAEYGPASLPDNRSHHVSTEEPKIWQFDVTGTLRLLWFYDEGKMVVITQSFYKAGGKKGTTPRKLVNQAQDTYRRYFEAKERGELEIVEEDSHEDQ